MRWPLNLHRVRDRRLLRAYAAQHKPQDLWTSPDCSAFTPVQRINHARCGEHWRPPGEKKALDMIGHCRLMHMDQHARGGRGHHEQSAGSRMPFDGAAWPCAARFPAGYVDVYGCQVGLQNSAGEFLSKA